jgi:LPXTG-motif cell wall-anchored protein
VDFGDSATGFGIAAGLGLLAAAAMMLRNRRKLATGF